MALKRIAAMLGVSPATAHNWTSDIELTPEQRDRNLRGPGGPQCPEQIRRRAAAWAGRNRERRAQFQEEGRERARQGDPLHLAGCMLYWAEGAKGRNTLKFSNSDPCMVSFFSRFLTGVLRVPASQIRLSLNVYTGNGLSVDDIERHWLDRVGLTPDCVRKHTLDHMTTSSSVRATNKLPYGVCTLRVDSTRVVQHVFGAIQEYGGIEEPAWLD
jgi:hypothetical protein